MSTSRWSRRAGVALLVGALAAGLGPGCSGSGLPLVGSRWILVRIESADGTIHTPIIDAEREPPHLVFATIDGADEARVSGSGGCNRVSGGYTVDEHHLTFSELMSTRMSCGPELDAEEHRFLDALARVEAYEIEGSRLVMRFEGGNLIFDGTAAPDTIPQ